MFRAKALFFLAALTTAAQVTSIPSGVGGGPGGATSVSGLTDLKVTGSITGLTTNTGYWLRLSCGSDRYYEFTIVR